MAKLERFWTSDPTVASRVTEGFVLTDAKTNSRHGFDGRKSDGKRALAEGGRILSELQQRMFAWSAEGDKRRILLVLQAMDTAGKGGVVAHVVGVVNPDGVRYRAFKKPSEEELAHDFLWRVERELPAPGQIGVFDRSHYEDVLIARVRKLADPSEIERRYGAINEFEAGLVAAGTTVIKVMLHISPDEQKKRLRARLERPDKYWKFNPSDIDERLLWHDYEQAYQVAFDRTSTQAAPWWVVPADKKWYARLVVQHLLIDALERMNLDWPPPNFDVEAQRARLEAS